MKKEKWQTAATVAVGFGIAFLIVGSSQTFQSCIGEHYHHEPSETFQKGVAQFLIMLKSGSACTGEFVHKNAESIIALFTVILGIATWLLWRATKRLVEGADRNAERQLRAYVLAVQGRVRRFAINEPIDIGITTKNTGQTPGYDFHQTISIAMTDYPPNEPHEDIVWSEPIYKSIIGPGEFSSSFADFPNFKLSEGQFREIKAGKAAIWAYGEIRYRDAFGKRHVTKFKFIYTGDIVTDPPGGMSLEASGNEAD
jgi:hypothetical protein